MMWPILTVVIVTIMLFTEGQTIENIRSDACTIKPATQHDARLLERSIWNENRMIWLTINNIDTISNLNESTDIVNPKQWVLTTDEPHKQLLLLGEDFIPMSLWTLSFSVDKITIDLRSVPSECLMQFNVSDQESLIYRQMLDNIFNSSVALPESSEVCLQQIRDNGKGTAEIYYRCYDGFQNYNLRKGPWMKALQAIHICAAFLVTNLFVYLILMFWKSIASDQTFVLKNVDMSTPALESLCVKNSFLTERASYPTTLISFIYNRICCCNFNFKTRNTDNYSKFICCCLCIRNITKKYPFIFMIPQAFMTLIPFIIASVFKISVPIEEVAYSRNMTTSIFDDIQFEGNKLMIYIYYCSLSFILLISVLLLLHKCCSTKPVMDELKNKLTLIPILSHTGRTLYNRMCEILLGFSKKTCLLRWILLPLFVVYLALNLFMNLPTVYFVISLPSNMFRFCFPKCCKDSKTNINKENIPKTTKDDKDDRSQILEEINLDCAAIAFCVGIFGIPYLYSIYFYIKVFAYTAIGLQLNFEYANKYFVMVILVLVYCYHCFHKVSLNTHAYSVRIHDYFQNKFKQPIQELLDNAMKKDVYTCINDSSEEKQSSSYGIVWHNVHENQRGRGNKRITLGPNVLTNNEVLNECSNCCECCFVTKIDKTHYQENHDKMLPLIYFIDASKGMFYLPRRFIFEALDIEDTFSPGPLGWQYFKALIEFLLCVLLLFFVIVIVYALGQGLTINATGQTAFAVAGGFLPFLLEKMYSKSSGKNKLKEHALDIWKYKIEKLASQKILYEECDENPETFPLIPVKVEHPYGAIIEEELD